MMSKSEFIYVTWIRTTPETLWQALLDPEFTRQYWFETWKESSWRVGDPWRLMIPDGRVGYSGDVLESEPGRRLVLTWRAEFKPEWRVEGDSRVVFELEPMGETVKLTVRHEMDKPNSLLIKTLSHGWPHLLASLKSLLETGESLAATRNWPKGL